MVIFKGEKLQTVGDYTSKDATEAQQAINLLELSGYKCILPYSAKPRVDQPLWFLVNTVKQEYVMTSLHPQAFRDDAVWLRLIHSGGGKWLQGDHYMSESLKEFYQFINDPQHR